MKVICKPFDTQHYLMNLRQHGGALQCDRMGDSYCLILRLPYQQDMDQVTPALFRQVLASAAAELVRNLGTFIRIGENAELGLFLHAAVLTGFTVTGAQDAAVTYAMFACELDQTPDTGEKTLTVYISPRGLFAADNFCRVPAVVQIRLHREITTKLFSKRFTGYYSVEFSGCTKLSQGSIWYTIPGCPIRYPVNSAMLRQKKIYIKSESEPEFHSVGGICVERI